MIEERTLLIKQLLGATRHHQQRAIGCLGLAAQHRGFEAGAVLVVNLLSQAADLGDAHGSHRHQAATVQIPELPDHRFRDRTVSQHRDDAAASL